MITARILVVIVGLVLPYAARLPGGTAWFHQYTQGGAGGLLFIGAFNALAWGALLGVTCLYKSPKSVIAPAVCGFGFLAWAHGSVDLAADAQAALALIAIPIFALVPIAIGGLIGYLVDRRLRGAHSA